jgi:hypothetical protein
MGKILGPFPRAVKNSHSETLALILEELTCKDFDPPFGFYRILYFYRGEQYDVEYMYTEMVLENFKVTDYSVSHVVDTILKGGYKLSDDAFRALVDLEGYHGD